jgi:RND family efflux transporter MFP subunit
MNDKSDLLADLKIHRDAEPVYPDGRRWAVVAVPVIVVLILTTGWLWYASRVTAVEVVSGLVSIQPSQQTASVLDASGYVTARRLATVSSKITGRVVEVLIEEGMSVAQGQLLARLDDASARVDFALSEAQLEAARIALTELAVLTREAKRSLGRSRDLRDRNLASEANLDAAQAEHDALLARGKALEQQVVVAERALAVQQQRLDDTEILAPFAGVVIAKSAQPGEMISPVSAGGGFTRTGIGTIVDMDSLEIEVDVNEAYIQRVKPEQSVHAVLDAYPNWQIPARVIAIIPAADRQKATVKVRIAFDQLDSRILPDMGVRVSFHSGDREQLPDTRPGVLVARTAVRKESGSEVVYRIVDGMARRQAVSSVGRVGDQVVISAGLSAGDRVVVEAPQKLKDGDLVVERGSGS